MNVEKTLRIALLNFPTIFPNAFSVYHHWFCVCGNGYEWENGELISYADYITTVEDAIIKQLEQSLISDWEEGLVKNILDLYTNYKGANVEFISKYIIRHNKETIKYVKMTFDIENRMADFDIRKELELAPNTPIQFYPISEYSKLYTIPDDIKDDWLYAVKKMVDIMEEHKFMITGDIDKYNEAKEKIYKLYDERRIN